MFRLALCLALVAWSAFACAGDAPTKEAKSRITHVTVYPGNALVTREVEVPEGAGLLELHVTPLPPQVVDGSLYSEGGDGIRVLTTRYRTQPILEDNREEVKKLNDERKKLALAKQDLEARQKVLADNLALLTKLEGFTSATMQHLTEKGVLSSEQTIALTKYIMDTRAAKADEATKVLQQLQANHEGDQFLTRKLQELSAGPSRTERSAVITLNKSNAAPGVIRLNYLVSSVSWNPQYKFRAGKDKDPISVEYLAAIRQQTGEDWANVAVTLSTAQPMLNAAPPELRTLTMSVVHTPAQVAGGRGGQALPALKSQIAFGLNSAPQGQFNPGGPAQPGGQAANSTLPLNLSVDNLEALQQARGNRSKAMEEANKKNYSIANQYWNEAAAQEQSVQLLTTKDEERQVAQSDLFGGASEGPTVTYKLPNGLSIPSRNDEQVVEVARLQLTPDYYYKAIPVLTKHVYRLANLTNKSDMVLLPGEATMYQGSDFVGRTHLPLVAIGEKFTVGLGVDPQLQASRKLLDKSRKMQGANQVLQYDYRILISSYKTEPVKVQVWDRLPTAESEVININVVKTTPDLSSDSLYQREERTKNLLRWDVTVEPNTFGEKAQTIAYQFKMELDKTLQVGALTK